MKFKSTVYLFLISLFHASAQTSLVGNWQAKDKNEEIILVLNQEGTGLFDGMKFRYEVENKELIATYDNGIFHYEFDIQNNQLILKEGNLDHPYVFHRSNTTIKEASSSPKIDEKLVGTWSNPSLTVQFNLDGTLNMMDGKRRFFSTENGKIKIFQENKMEETSYTLRNSMLSLALNGKVIQLRKQENTVNENRDTLKTVLPELTGKWCYISSAAPEAQMSGECVVLSQDGQFIFLHDSNQNKIRSERGEWWANMNSLYFLAQNGHTDTYRIAKKKHPSSGYLILNIDGRNFISADQKTSWQ